MSENGGASKSNSTNGAGHCGSSFFKEPKAVMSVSKYERFYKVNHKNRGIAVILNHEHFWTKNKSKKQPNPGTNADLMSFEKALKSLGFKTLIYEDQTVQSIMNILEDVSEEDHSDNDCFILVCLTCGKQGNLRARDNLYNPSILWSYFTAKKCSTLAGKPKLFFIQAREEEETDGSQVDSYPSYTIPDQADVLIVSVIPNMFTFNKETQSSWFAQVLCEKLNTYGFSEDILTLLTSVNRKIAENFESFIVNNPNKQVKKEIPHITSMLTRQLQFYKKDCDEQDNAVASMTVLDTPYKMNHKNRGFAVILNHKIFDTKDPRPGTSVDVNNLEKSLQRLGFHTEPYLNLTVAKIKQVLKKVSEKDHSDNDCFLLVCLTHGSLRGISASDNLYNPNELWSLFTEEKCPTLAGKPKLFFIQACQGGNLDAGVRLYSQVDSGSPYKIPSDPDFLIASATVPGFVAWRSWFIKVLSEKLDEFGFTEDLLTLLTYVSCSVAVDFDSYCPSNPANHGKKQIPSINSTLTRKLKFSENI
uniref:Caspase family p20 domain-containing protein n=1 Tax=Graphocephala atropunctata TaxID=36148 RepID=A0A1B6LB92_9HEMI